MAHPPALHDLAVILLASVLVSLVLLRFRVPVVAGLLAAGALSGPFGLGFVGNLEGIHLLAEAGVALLLFTIGLEFSLRRLVEVAKSIVLGGTLQVGVTTLAVYAACRYAGYSQGVSLFLGFVASQSSTAIVLRALADRGEIVAPHGRFIVGALIFQDLCVIPMMLVVPALGASASALQMGPILSALAKAVPIVAGAVFLARFVVPRLFHIVDTARSREIFLLAVLGTIVGTVGLTSLAGLSAALGAFLAGFIFGDTDYGHRAFADILPLRDVLSSLFFFSLGMLFDPRALTEEPLAVSLLVAVLLFGKGLVATLAALVMRFPARAAWLAGVGLAQFGEFSFVLVKLGESARLIAPAQTRLVLAAGVLTMFITPLALRAAPHIRAGERLLRPLERLLKARGIDEPAAEHRAVSGHVVVVGFGLAGRVLAGALKEIGIPYLILELNAETVRRARAAGESVYYGDVTSPEALSHARLREARALVLLINDPEAARRAISAARRHAPEIPIFVRTKYLADREQLLDLGATYVTSEELEGGMENMSRVLHMLETPRNVLADLVRRIRAHTQESRREVTVPRHRLAEMRDLADIRIGTYRLGGRVHAAQRTIRELQLRSRTHALLVAVKRNETLIESPDPELPLLGGDTVYLLGSSASIAKAINILEHGSPEEINPAPDGP